MNGDPTKYEPSQPAKAIVYTALLHGVFRAPRHVALFLALSYSDSFVLHFVFISLQLYFHFPNFISIDVFKIFKRKILFYVAVAECNSNHRECRIKKKN